MEPTQDNDLISLSNILVTLIKHIKLWLTLIILGIIASVALGLLHQDKYQHTAYFSGPNYLNQCKSTQLLSEKELEKLIDIHFRVFQHNHAQDALITNLKLNQENNQNSLSITAKKSDSKKVAKNIAMFIEFMNQQKGYQKRINDSINNAEYNIHLLAIFNKTYNDNMQKLQSNLDHLKKAEDIGNVNGQTLLNNLSNTMIAYQERILDNDSKMQNYQSQLQSLQKGISLFDDIVISAKPKGLTTPVIITLGTILSIILASIIVFLLAFIKNLKIEIRRKLVASE